MLAILHAATRRARVLFAVACLALCFAAPAAAQTCPSPYASVVGKLMAPVCGTTFAPGTFPSMKSGSLTCEPGLAPPTCASSDEFLVMAADGAKWQQRYLSV